MKCCCHQDSKGLLLTAIIAGIMPIAFAAATANKHASAVLDDPISGEWTGFAESESFENDLPLSVTFTMDDEIAVSGVFSTPDGDASFEGFFDIETQMLTGAVTPEGANWELTLKLDDDVLEGSAEETNSGMTATVTLERVQE